jgi:hypothetical protein
MEEDVRVPSEGDWTEFSKIVNEGGRLGKKAVIEAYLIAHLIKLTK